MAEEVPFFLQAGGGSLVWWRMRQAGLAATKPLRAFRDNYRHNLLDRARHEEELRKVLSRLRAAGVEPLLIKGWAVARLYADPGLRPCGDIDLCVAPGRLREAEAVLRNQSNPAALVDLHAAVPDLPDRPWDEVFRRSRLVSLGGVEVRVPCLEDQLRVVCLHLVRHAAWRPLWLCDVAALLEALPAKFDWDYCLSGNPRRSEWVVWMAALAGRLLGARVNPEVLRRGRKPPHWLREAVLWGWGRGPSRRPCAYYARHPLEAATDLLNEGLNPIKATFRLGVRPRHRLPLLLVRLADCAAHLTHLRVKLRRRLARWRGRPSRNLLVHEGGTF
jgi:hypothetical protein